MNVISIRNLKICYGDIEVISNFSLDIKKGEFFTLLGPSGCGKTTVLRAIAGFVKVSSGEIFLDGKNITHLPAEHRDVGIVFQNYALFPHMTIFENVAFGLKVARRTSSEIKKAVNDILEVTGIAEQKNKKPEALSGGQQQRAAIARSLVMGTKIMLFDEPLSNLDAKVRDVMRKEIKRLQRELEFTAIFVTHDQTEALSLSDRLLVFNQGHAEQINTARNLYREPTSPFVCEFIGETNPLGPEVLSILGQPTDICCFIRPETIELCEIDSNKGFVATISDVDYLGATTRIELEYKKEVLVALALSSGSINHLREGQEIRVLINPDNLLKFKNS